MTGTELFDVGTRWVAEPREGPGPTESVTCTAVDRERGVVTFDRPGSSVPAPTPLYLRTHPFVTRYLKRAR